MDIRPYFKSVSFTKNEVKVILFIVTVLVVGFSVKYYKHIINADTTPYDFSESDNLFRQRSMLLHNGKIDTTDNFSPEEKELMEKMQSEEAGSESNSYFKQKNKIELTEKSININTAAKEELIALPGIGEAIAERIIVYRQKKTKGFSKIEDIMNVKGIGKKKFEKIKPFIKTE